MHILVSVSVLLYLLHRQLSRCSREPKNIFATDSLDTQHAFLENMRVTFPFTSLLDFTFYLDYVMILRSLHEFASR